jgi:hypothetical protein
MEKHTILRQSSEPAGLRFLWSQSLHSLTLKYRSQLRPNGIQGIANPYYPLL